MQPPAPPLATIGTPTTLHVNLLAVGEGVVVAACAGCLYGLSSANGEVSGVGMCTVLPLYVRGAGRTVRGT